MAAAEMTADELALAASFSGEAIVYLEGGESPGRTIRAIVRRQQRATDGSDGRDLRRQRIQVRITKRATDGVPAVQVRRDQVQLKARSGDAAASTFHVVRILWQDAATWRLELER